MDIAKHIICFCITKNWDSLTEIVTLIESSSRDSPNPDIWYRFWDVALLRPCSVSRNFLYVYVGGGEMYHDKKTWKMELPHKKDKEEVEMYYKKNAQ